MYEFSLQVLYVFYYPTICILLSLTSFAPASAMKTFTKNFCAPRELHGLRHKTAAGQKFCFNYNLGKRCADDCAFAHDCMRCGRSKCWAQGCFLLKSEDPSSDEGIHNDDRTQDDHWYSPKRSSSKSSRYDPYCTSYSAPRWSSEHTSSSSSSRPEAVTVLSEKIAKLEQRVEAVAFKLTDCCRTLKRMEQTLTRHGYGLASFEEISDSDLD